MRNIFIMRNIVIISLLFVINLGCSEYQKVLKSTDYEYKYEKALEYYKNEQYAKAVAVLEGLIPIYRGTNKEEEVTYYYANANYKQGDYILAGYYFRNFAKTFPNSEYIEEAEFKSAYCYYLDSPRYSLDQTNTHEAISAFQRFINRHPLSDKVKQANILIDELRDRLEKKAFMSAKLYYDLGNYKASSITFKNMLEEYPDSKYRETAYFLIMKSKFLYAENSVQKKQEERYKSAVKEYYPFIDKFPNSEYLKEAEKIYETCQDKLKEFDAIAETN